MVFKLIDLANLCLFGRKMDLKDPEKVSIWEAYRKGYEQAYKEIEESLSHNHS